MASLSLLSSLLIRFTFPLHQSLCTEATSPRDLAPGVKTSPVFPIVPHSSRNCTTNACCSVSEGCKEDHKIEPEPALDSEVPSQGVTCGGHRNHLVITIMAAMAWEPAHSGWLRTELAVPTLPLGAARKLHSSSSLQGVVWVPCGLLPPTYFLGITRCSEWVQAWPSVRIRSQNSQGPLLLWKPVYITKPQNFHCLLRLLERLD